MPTYTKADTIRILVATDSHVGFEERDPIRKDDSWKSFDEVMQLAKTEDVDMVLLAGDLFHDNKPSRKAMYQVMRSLRQNCLGEKPCELELLSDASEVFEGAFNHVNYEDPDINVATPVFSIHGNHDDPTGDGHYCSLDLLQVSGLLNYYGRTPESDRIEIKPVLLQKGQTKLALYGMSNVRDERLFRTFRDGNVKFFRPNQQQNDWFNMIAVHQNHHAHNETGYLPENFLPEFLDLVVWGHEHECLIDPRLNPEMMFQVMQPGSSVATSLVPGEAVPKHVAIVSVSGKDFTIEKHRLKTVRPFITRDLVLSNDDYFSGLAKVKDNRTKLTSRLIEVVNDLIEEATKDWKDIQDGADIDPEDIPLPLVRLKVEYTAYDGGKFDCENPQRFSNRFVGKVANVNDVVQFYRKKVTKRSDKTENEKPSAAILESMAVDDVKVETLVHEYLAAQALKILPQAPFGNAISEYVREDDKHAMNAFIEDSLSNQVREIMSYDIGDEMEDLDPVMEKIKADREKLYANGELKSKKRTRKVKPRPNNWDSDLDGEWADQPGAMIFTDAEDEDEAPATKGRRKKAATAASDEDEEEDDDDASIISGQAAKKAKPTKKAPAKRAPAKKAPAKPKATTKAKAPAKAPARGRNKVLEPSDDEDDDVVMLDDPPAKPQPKRAAATRGRQTQLSFTQPKTQTAQEISDDEISDDDDAFEPAVVSSSRRR